ncbi:hypothetical protein TNIN_260961 [Trichonephila inaurata madagascariensis]|uniref:Uncharacterized protein n=1 Tax=Trichonephila inaurata madagascariensis TaxID=2747483 RepID=A0A8X6Y2N4_9ARAC|nr:hypothetical protein TNIN_260961 [Trichonephila inaurata madagascariensis]
MLRSKSQTPPYAGNDAEAGNGKCGPLMTKIKKLEGKMTEFFLAPKTFVLITISLKRSKDLLNRSLDRLNSRQKPPKPKLPLISFSLRKQLKAFQRKKKEEVTTNNSFAALNTAQTDAEDVSPPQYKIKPIFMKVLLILII